MKATEILFDSTTDNWKEKTSVFHSKLKGKEKLVFFIETTENITIGGVFINRITKITSEIDDRKCFLFNTKSGTMKKFQINPMSSSYALKICSRFDQDLFIFGDDLIEKKEEFKNKSSVNEKGSMFTNSSRNALLGKVGTFSVKRIRVIHFI